jgi:hypothetical protein
MSTENTEDLAGVETRAARDASNRNTPLSDALLVICALAGLGIIALSFMTWMDIMFIEEVGEETLTVVTHPRGTDASALTSFGDGYMTAVFGVVAVGLAIACRWAGRWAFYCAAGLAVAGLSTVAIGVYNLAYNRADSGSGAFGISVQVEVSRTAALWGLTGLGILLAVVAFSLLAVIWPKVAPISEVEDPA